MPLVADGWPNIEILSPEEAARLSEERQAWKWPQGCRHRSSCARHKACMYVMCQHTDAEVRDALAEIEKGKK